MKKYLAEFVGTFSLIFISEGTYLVNGITNGALGLVGIALANGFVLMTLIYSLIHVSGAFFNPAITITMFVHKRIGGARAAGYVLCQVAGGAAAGLLLLLLFPNASAQQHYGLPQDLDFWYAVVVEGVLTFFLISTIYGAFVNKFAPAGFYGFTIGSVLIFDTLLGGPVTGAAMNPARAFGPAVASGIWGPQLIYWIGPIAGALLGSFIFEYLLSGQKKEPR
jgi:MIP family channel proteins